MNKTCPTKKRLSRWRRSLLQKSLFSGNTARQQSGAEQSRAEQSRAERPPGPFKGPRPVAQHAYAEPGLAYCDGGAMARASDTPHVLETNINISRGAKDRERKRHTVGWRRGEFARVLVTWSYTHRRDSSLLRSSFLARRHSLTGPCPVSSPSPPPPALSMSRTGPRWVPEYPQCPLGLSTPRAGRTKRETRALLEAFNVHGPHSSH